jgi:hypothetical protein
MPNIICRRTRLSLRSLARTTLWSACVPCERRKMSGDDAQGSEKPAKKLTNSNFIIIANLFHCGNKRSLRNRNWGWAAHRIDWFCSRLSVTVRCILVLIKMKAIWVHKSDCCWRLLVIHFRLHWWLSSRIRLRYPKGPHCICTSKLVGRGWLLRIRYFILK